MAARYLDTVFNKSRYSNNFISPTFRKLKANEKVIGAGRARDRTDDSVAQQLKTINNRTEITTITGHIASVVRVAVSQTRLLGDERALQAAAAGILSSHTN